MLLGHSPNLGQDDQIRFWFQQIWIILISVNQWNIDNIQDNKFYAVKW